MRRRWVVMAWLVGPGCGPTVELDTGSGTESSTETSPGDGSADESGSPGQGCGVGDTELLGGGPPGALGFPPPCAPIDDPGVNGYRCCSDDPAAADGMLPAYEGKGIMGSAPFFAEANNDLSRSGICVDVTQLAGQGLIGAPAQDCPIPCNPTWSASDIDTVCGPARQCCQTVELEPEDCVQDPDTGLFRPVTGEDIGMLTSWRPADHATHQDPNGTGCLGLAGGDSSSPTFQSCVRALSVANQRGFCMALGPGQVCPSAQPTYVDACDRLNGG